MGKALGRASGQAPADRVDRDRQRGQPRIAAVERVDESASLPGSGAVMRSADFGIWSTVARYGYVGALAFSAAAWRLEARDQWIGWSEPARRQNLSRVGANSRFLIVPYVKAPNLASHVLGTGDAAHPRQTGRTATAKIRCWWKHSLKNNGTGAHAIGQAIGSRHGETKGRGRQDPDNQQAVAIKKVLLYTLDRDARQILSGCETRCGPKWSPDDRAPLEQKRLGRRGIWASSSWRSAAEPSDW